MATRKGFTINRGGDPQPWDTIEDQFHDDIIDTVVVGTVAAAKDATNGHRHMDLYSSGANLCCEAYESGNKRGIEITESGGKYVRLTMDSSTEKAEFTGLTAGGTFQVDIDGDIGLGDNNINDVSNIYGDSVDGALNINPAIGGKIGFFDATAVVQPSSTGETTGFTAGSGTGVNDDSTFTGNVGSIAYRINDVVKHLKTLGLLDS